MRSVFARLDEKRYLQEIFEKPFLRELRKTHYFSIFSKNLTKHAFNFSPLDEKHKLLGNFEKIFENFEKIFIKIAKNAIFRLFFI